MTYEQSMADAIVERLSRESLRQICAEDGMPDRRTVERWMADDAEFAAKCARAREVHAAAMFDDMEDIEDQVLAGDIKPDAARVVLSSRQWRLAKIRPKVYGDKIDLNHAGSLKVSLDSTDGGLL